MVNLVFVVCHPDDESIWCGGMLSEFSKIPGYACHVICLSGKDSDSPREQEFIKAKQIAAYKNGVVLGFKLRNAHDPLPPISTTVENGLKSFQLLPNEIDLLITHSPYGDEMQHPHHKQAYVELRRWCSEKNVSFGYFSCIQLPFVSHQSVLGKPARRESFHILQLCRVRRTAPLLRILIDKHFRKYFHTPKYYVQLMSDLNVKAQMIRSYQSIELTKHFEDYVTSNSPVEALYLFDDRGYSIFRTLVKTMMNVENPYPFLFLSYRFRIRCILNRWFKKN